MLHKKIRMQINLLMSALSCTKHSLSRCYFSVLVNKSGSEESCINFGLNRHSFKLSLFKQKVVEGEEKHSFVVS